ncbi:hypothetical protein [Haliangium ochraceum]|uniref:Uncharacterized protein n=1 Tax=Haliangium ochraceum (strain DSM 14365 / JCM 11303 / SMP-2) TaxID=502025 RepID=D0LXP0_HALO1|nr:hypothetical protein [Haliangium ochraceum]ACY17795.1 hypothetical protein Hoch_5310 [Haliangium ochraceum DSM 14365]
MGPYREADAVEVLEVASQGGVARIERAPKALRIDIGRSTLTVAQDFVTLIRRPRRRGRNKQRSIRLSDTRLFLARGVPTGDLGIWCESQPEQVERLLGLRPPELLDEQALESWSVVNRLAPRLRTTLGPHGRGAQRATEVGEGVDRVLMVDFGDHLAFYVRRLFRKRAQLAMRVFNDGAVVLPGKGEAQRLHCHSRYGVTVLGDYLRFADPKGQDLGSLSIPWVTPEDRAFLVKCIGRRIDPHGATDESPRVRHGSHSPYSLWFGDDDEDAPSAAGSGPQMGRPLTGEG